MSSPIKSALENLARLPVTVDTRLAPYTSFRIGGPAALFVEVQSIDELSRAVAAAEELALETLILGGGTNLLVSDSGFDGLVIRPLLTWIDLDVKQGFARVGAGVSSADLVDLTIEAGLEGLEFAAGLPGTVGGAVSGNAGCFGKTFGEMLIEATVLDRRGSRQRVTNPSWFGFSYRGSTLAGQGAILAEATFALRTADKSTLAEQAAANRAVRLQRHPPPGTATAGSYFKNLRPARPGGPYQPAGALLDQAGAKQLTVGDAAVFERHANIIINREAARARDVLELANLMAAGVKDRFAIDLEPEVRFVGPIPPSGPAEE